MRRISNSPCSQRFVRMRWAFFKFAKGIQVGTIMLDMSEAFKSSVTCISDSLCGMNFGGRSTVCGRHSNGSPKWCPTFQALQPVRMLRSVAGGNQVAFGAEVANRDFGMERLSLVIQRHPM